MKPEKGFTTKWTQLSSISRTTNSDVAVSERRNPAGSPPRATRNGSRRGPEHWPTRVGWHTLQAEQDQERFGVLALAWASVNSTPMRQSETGETLDRMTEAGTSLTSLHRSKSQTGPNRTR